MMNEKHISYELGIAEDGSTRYSLSVREGQGFAWNPDLFVSRFRQHQDYCETQYSETSCPQVQDILVDESEDIFPSDY
jgi:hypothetical protein